MDYEPGAALKAVEDLVVKYRKVVKERDALIEELKKVNNELETERRRSAPMKRADEIARGR